MANFHNYALLVVVAVPVFVVLAMNAWAFFMGERDTLMFPVPKRFPSVEADLAPPRPAAPAQALAVPTVPVRDEAEERLAA